jgi:hypothetical protein
MMEETILVSLYGINVKMLSCVLDRFLFTGLDYGYFLMHHQNFKRARQGMLLLLGYTVPGLTFGMSAQLPDLWSEIYIFVFISTFSEA